MVISLSTEGQIINQTGFNRRFDLQTSRNLSLKSSEGNQISFYLRDKFNFSKLEQKVWVSDESETFEFSLSSKAASDFYSKVSGELNEEELTTIRKLIQVFTPISSGFISKNGFDREQTGEAFSEAFVVAQGLEVSLGKTVQTLWNGYGDSKGKVAGLDVSQLPKGIRDLNSLIESV